MPPRCRANTAGAKYTGMNPAGQRYPEPINLFFVDMRTVPTPSARSPTEMNSSVWDNDNSASRANATW